MRPRGYVSYASVTRQLRLKAAWLRELREKRKKSAHARVREKHVFYLIGKNIIEFCLEVVNLSVTSVTHVTTTLTASFMCNQHRNLRNYGGL